MNKKNMLLFSLLCAASFDISSAKKTPAISISEKELRTAYDFNLTSLSNALDSKSQQINNICDQYEYLESLKKYQTSQYDGYKRMAEGNIITWYKAIKDTDEQIDQFHKNIGKLYNSMKDKKMNINGLDGNPPKDNETLKQALKKLQGLEDLNNGLAQKLQNQAGYGHKPAVQNVNETSRGNQQGVNESFKQNRQAIAEHFGAEFSPKYKIHRKAKR